jgi:hypothetical protein
VNERDPEGGGSVSELMRAKGGTIVEINLSGKPPLAQSLDQTVGQVFEVFLEIELSMGNEARMIVQKGKEKTLSYLPLDDHRRPMHTVGLPEIVGQLGFIPSEIRFEPLGFIEPPSLKEPIEALDGSMKVGRQKLPFPCNPKNHGQGSPFEFSL